MQHSLRRSKRTGLTIILLVLMGCFAAFSASAQTTVSGKITSGEDKSPLPGVNVIIKGSANGTITDVNGDYHLTANSDATLVVSYLGFITQEVPVGSRTTVDIVLATDTKQLNEVVVTALGIRRDAKTIGYANQVVQGSDLTKAREPNTVNSLVGKVAGLSIGTSPELMGRPNVVLRGNTDVLFVVNGVPVNSDTWNLPADDIDTYTVLKGPNAAALYGFRGQNGAIVITTKRATKNVDGDGKNWTIDINSSTMMEKGFTAFPNFQTDYGRGSNFAYTYGNGVYDYNSAGGGLVPILGSTGQRWNNWGPKLEGELVRQYDSPYDPPTNTRTPTPLTARGAKNLQNFAQPGILSTNNIAFAQAGEGYDVRVSYSHTAQRGMIPNTGLNVENLNINSNFELGKKLTMEARVNLNYQHAPNLADPSYGPNSLSYLFGVYGSADWDVRTLKDYNKAPMGSAGVEQYNFEYGRDNNPYFMAHEWLRGHKKTDFFGSMKLDYKVNKDFNISFRTQITTWGQTRTEKLPAGIHLNTYIPYWHSLYHGDYRVDQRNLFENNTDLLLNYKKKVSDFNINAFVGASTRVFSYSSTWTSTHELSIPGAYNFNNSINNTLMAYAFNSNMNVYSGYYSVDLGYKNFFNLSTTGRVDNSSAFPKGNNTWFYPSVALSSVISDYTRLPEAISFLKVRASYADVKGGLTQSQAPSAYMLTTGSSVNSLIGYGSELYSAYDGPSYSNQSRFSPASINGQNSLSYPSNIADPKVKPFSVTSYEAGLDIRFLENRLGLDVTAFRSLNGPNITQLPVDPMTGYYTKSENALTTVKKGLEITVNGNPVKTDNFRWDVLVNWSTFRERLYSIGGGLPSISLNGHNYTVGERMDAYYGRALVRDTQGDVIYAGGVPMPALTGNSNNSFLGNMNPDWTFGINNKFTYKSVSFSFQFDGRVGGKIFDYQYYKMFNGGTAKDLTQGAYGVARNAEWQSVVTQIGGLSNYDAVVIANTLPKPTPSYVGQGKIITSGTPTIVQGKITNSESLGFADNTTATTVQNLAQNSLQANFDEPFMISRSYAKLREVNFTYNIPVTFFGKTQTLIRRASISLVGRNLLYFAARKDFDIDQYASGYNAQSRSLNTTPDLSSPTTRRYGININIGF